jgi:hypothetical protein
MMQLLIDPTGRVRCLYGEEIDLASFGPLQIARASQVEPTLGGDWTADLRSLGGPILGPFPHRSQALTAERDWLLENWLKPSS